MNNGFNDPAAKAINRVLWIVGVPMVALVYYLYVHPVVLAAFQ